MPEAAMKPRLHSDPNGGGESAVAGAGAKEAARHATASRRASTGPHFGRATIIAANPRRRTSQRRWAHVEVRRAGVGGGAPGTRGGRGGGTALGEAPWPALLNV